MGMQNALVSGGLVDMTGGAFTMCTFQECELRFDPNDPPSIVACTFVNEKVPLSDDVRELLARSPVG